MAVFATALLERLFQFFESLLFSMLLPNFFIEQACGACSNVSFWGTLIPG
jgi:hypothetical protein